MLRNFPGESISGPFAFGIEGLSNFILPSATMSGYTTLGPSGENEADVNLKKRTRVTTTSYPCVENEREGSEGGLGGEKAVLLRIL